VLVVMWLWAARALAADGGSTCALTNPNGEFEGQVRVVLRKGSVVATFSQLGQFELSTWDGAEELTGAGIRGALSGKLALGTATRVRVTTADARCDWTVEGDELHPLEEGAPPPADGWVREVTPCRVDGGVATLTVQSPADAEADEAKHAAAEVRPPTPTPPGGRVLVDLQMPTIELADQHVWVVVVQHHDGPELARYDRDPDPRGVGWSVPSPIPGMASTWRNLLVVDLPEPVQGPVHIRLANRATASTCDWDVQ
jgi:hypothetical protein